MKKFKLILNTILILFISISKSYSLVEVDITRGNLNPLPIAVSPLFQDNNSNTTIWIVQSFEQGCVSSKT